MGNVDAALVQQVFDIPQRHRVTDIHHHREADDLGTGLEIPENAGVAHPIRLAAPPFSGNPIFNLTVPSGGPPAFNIEMQIASRDFVVQKTSSKTNKLLQ